MDNSKLQQYQTFKNDLLAEIDEINALIGGIDRRICALTGESPASTATAQHESEAAKPVAETKSASNDTKQETPTLGVMDTAEQVLRQQNRPIHAKRLFSLTIAQSNGSASTSPRSLANSLKQDRKHRFENLGKNVWALRAWDESMKASFRAVD
jgi:hypothetical protein